MMLVFISSETIITFTGTVSNVNNSRNSPDVPFSVGDSITANIDAPSNLFSTLNLTRNFSTFNDRRGGVIESLSFRETVSIGTAQITANDGAQLTRTFAQGITVSASRDSFSSSTFISFDGLGTNNNPNGLFNGSFSFRRDGVPTGNLEDLTLGDLLRFVLDDPNVSSAFTLHGINTGAGSNTFRVENLAFDFSFENVDLPAASAAVPEPSTYISLLFALIALGFYRRK